jgi:hypothetical protein
MLISSAPPAAARRRSVPSRAVSDPDHAYSAPRVDRVKQTSLLVSANSLLASVTQVAWKTVAVIGLDDRNPEAAARLITITRPLHALCSARQYAMLGLSI